VLTQLSDKAAASLKVYNEQANTRAAELREKANTTDFVALRENAASVATSIAQLAQDRAIAVYTELVARGERVVGTGVIEAADVVNADIETTEEPKAVEATVTEAKAVEAAPKAPRKRAKPAAPRKPAAE
jgi:hypothetical protein